MSWSVVLDVAVVGNGKCYPAGYCYYGSMRCSDLFEFATRIVPCAMMMMAHHY